jgi:hypothetical protein
MKLKELLLAQLDRETEGTRSAVKRVPEGKNSWNPHDKSMKLGYLAGLVATMPAWIEGLSAPTNSISRSHTTGGRASTGAHVN